jgi:hypothetical protein
LSAGSVFLRLFFNTLFLLPLLSDAVHTPHETFTLQRCEHCTIAPIEKSNRKENPGYTHINAKAIRSAKQLE